MKLSFAKMSEGENFLGSGEGPAPYNTNSIRLTCKAGILILSNTDLIEILSPREKNSYNLVNFKHKAANL